MKKFVKYVHHGIKVSVREDLKGTHREVCLCYDCAKFNPDPAENCPVAQMVYELDEGEGLVTPVFECPEFEEGERYVFQTKTGQP